MKKVILLICAFIVLLVVGVGLWAYFAFLYTKPLTKAELAELTPDWSVVTHGNWSPWFTEADGTQTWNPAASFNAWLATVPEEDKAWPVLIELKYANAELFEYGALGMLPDDSEEWRVLIELFERDDHAGIVDQLHAALANPVMGCGFYFTTDPYEHDAMVRHGIEDDDWDPNLPIDSDLLSMLIPTYSPHRDAVQALSSYSAHRLVEGDADGYIDLIESVMGSSELSLEFPVMIGQLVSTAIKAVGQANIVWAIENHSDQFTDEHLERLDDILARHQRVNAGWQGEALWFHDTLRRVSSADGKLNITNASEWGSGYSASNAYTGSPSYVPDAQLHKSLQRPMYLFGKALSLMEDQCALPWDESLISSYGYLESNFGSVNFAVKLIIDMMMPATSNFAARLREYEQVAIANRLLIAVHRHRLEHGAFPDAFEQIDVLFLRFKPVDAFNGQTLRYKRTKNGPLIYSVGDNRVDDQGEPMWENSKGNTLMVPNWSSSLEVEQMLESDTPPFGGDWVLYPEPRNEKDD